MAVVSNFSWKSKAVSQAVDSSSFAISGLKKEHQVVIIAPCLIIKIPAPNPSSNKGRQLQAQDGKQVSHTFRRSLTDGPKTKTDG